MSAGLLTAVTAALVAGPVMGSCPRSLRIFPQPGSVVPTNVRFTLEGQGSERERVLELVGRDVRLKSRDDVVTAKVLPGWSSQRERAAVVLRPRTYLRPNQVYRLLLDPVLPKARLQGAKSDWPTWRTGRGPDEEPPRWNERPVPMEGRSEGNGPSSARWVKLRASLKDKSPLFLVVTLVPSVKAPSSPTQEYVVPVESGAALVGGEACEGGFELEPGQMYQASLEPHDAAGNIGPVMSLEMWAPKEEP